MFVCLFGWLCVCSLLVGAVVDAFVCFPCLCLHVCVVVVSLCCLFVRLFVLCGCVFGRSSFSGVWLCVLLFACLFA